MKLVRIPQRFSIDCHECDCETPEPVKVTKQHFWIPTERNGLMDELISRAIYYCETDGFSAHVIPLCMSARATLKALHKANILNDYEVKKCKFFLNS